MGRLATWPRGIILSSPHRARWRSAARHGAGGGTLAALLSLDEVMQRWVDVKGVFAVMLVGLDGDHDEAAAETMRRHATADLDRMGAALDVAWNYFVRGDGDSAGAQGGTQ